MLVLGAVEDVGGGMRGGGWDGEWLGMWKGKA